MIQINEKLISKNYSKRVNHEIKYIVIHDTGNTGYRANANAHYELFNREDRGASAHYFVDDTQILRIVKDENRSWAVGDGNDKYGISNDNSISIEMCINRDGDFNKTYSRTIELTRYLMGKYNIPIERVVRHYDASKKLCPNIFRANNWEKWYKFKNELIIKDYRNSITLIYQRLFQRDPDNEGLEFWNKKLNEGLDFGDFLKEIGKSEEFKEIYGTK